MGAGRAQSGPGGPALVFERGSASLWRRRSLGTEAPWCRAAVLVRGAAEVLVRLCQRPAAHAVAHGCAYVGHLHGRGVFSAQGCVPSAAWELPLHGIFMVGVLAGVFSKRVSWFRRLLNQIWVWELAGVVLCRYSGGGDRDAVGVMGTTAGPRACSCGSDPCLTVRFVVVPPGELVV